MDQYHTTFEQVQRDRAVTIGDINLQRERYQYHQEQKNAPTTYQRQVLHHYHDDNPLNQLFFSKPNIDALQIQIRKGVYDKSGGEFVIGAQDETELIITMRSVFLQHSRNIPACDSIVKQVKELNEVVVNEVVPKIMSEIMAYKIFIRDSSTLYNERPIERPLNVSSKGTRTFSFTNHF